MSKRIRKPVSSSKESLSAGGMIVSDAADTHSLRIDEETSAGFDVYCTIADKDKFLEEYDAHPTTTFMEERIQNLKLRAEVGIHIFRNVPLA